MCQTLVRTSSLSTGIVTPFIIGDSLGMYIALACSLHSNRTADDHCVICCAVVNSFDESVNEFKTQLASSYQNFAEDSGTTAVVASLFMSVLTFAVVMVTA
jgi:hypothetical protein